MDTVIVTALSNPDTFLQIETYSLDDHVENVGVLDFNVVGNKLSNVLVGNNFSNTLSGEGGADTLNGGVGLDTLEGGAGLATSTETAGFTIFVANLSRIASAASMDVPPRTGTRSSPGMARLPTSLTTYVPEN